MDNAPPPVTDIFIELLKSEYDKARELLRNPMSDTDPSVVKQLLFTFGNLHALIKARAVPDAARRDAYIDEFESLENELGQIQDLKQARHIGRETFEMMTAYIEENGLFRAEAPKRGLRHVDVPAEELAKVRR